MFRRLDSKPLVFGTFGEMSSNVKEVGNMAVEYGVEHLDWTMAATTVNGVRTTLRRSYIAQLSLAVWINEPILNYMMTPLPYSYYHRRDEYKADWRVGG